MLSRVKGSIAGKVQSLKKGKGSKASAAELADDGSAAAPSPSAPRQNRVIRKARVPDEERVTALPKSFFDAEFDPCLYVLQEAERKDIVELEEFRDENFNDLHAVSRTFSRLVSDNADKFVGELARVSELQDELEFTTMIVGKERQLLERAGKGVSQGLTLVQKACKRKALVSILQMAEEVQGLTRTQAKLKDLLQRQAFLEAIDLARDCTEKLIQYSELGLTVVDELAGSLENTYTTIEEYLDRALAELCVDFDIVRYEEVIAAFTKLGRAHAVTDRLGAHFVKGLQDGTKAVVDKHTRRDKAATEAEVVAEVELPVRRRAGSVGTVPAKHFKQLCADLGSNSYESCLVDLCEAACAMMVDFHTMVEWLCDKQKTSATNACDSESANAVAEQECSVEKDDGNEGKVDDEHHEANTPPLDATLAAASNGAAVLAEIVAVTSPPTVNSGGAASTVDLFDDNEAPTDTSNLLSAKLRGQCRRFWHDVQRQIVCFLQAIDFEKSKLSSFMLLLGHVRRLINIGEDFSKSPSDILEAAIRQISLAFFHSVHARNLEQLRDQLNHDSWSSIQIGEGFNIYFLKEFGWLRRQKKGLSKASSDKGPHAGAENAAGTDEGSSAGTLARFGADRELFRRGRGQKELNAEKVKISGSKIDKTSVTSQTDTHRLNSLSSDTDPKAPAPDSQAPTDTAVQPVTVHQTPPPPHCSESAMRAVRFFGQYLQMMDVLKPIAGEVFESLVEMVSFIFNTIWGFFGKDGTAYGVEVLSEKARGSINRMFKSTSIEQNLDPSGTAVPQAAPEPAVMSDDVELTNESSLYGMAARVTGMESLTFLTMVLRSMQLNLRKRLPSSHARHFNSFFTELVEPIPELRWFVYKNSSAKLMNFDEMIRGMGTVKWDVKEILSQHNPYVDVMIRDLTIVAQRINSLGDRRLPPGPYETVWNELNLQVNQGFVGGFSQAKKCSSEGRALMQLDYRQYLSKVQSLTRVKPQPEYVDTFITSYYLQEDEIEPFITKNAKKYTTKQFINMISVMAVRIGKKERQRLMKVIEDR